MPTILKRNKALSVNPLKSSPTIGAALAFLGVNRAMPMLHGSQGCSAFAKNFFVNHFREPIPMQTTAIDQTSAVLGGDRNVIDGLDTICRLNEPDLIGVATTGLTETEGADVNRLVREFRAQYPQHAGTAVVAVETPDYSGCLETGFAAATAAMIEALVPDDASRTETIPTQITILVGSEVTPGDIDVLKDMAFRFGLTAVVVPDVSDSLDGHLPEVDFSPISTGGVSVDAIRDVGRSAATLVIGRAMDDAANRLKRKTGIADYRFAHVMGLGATDRLVMALAEISGRTVPAFIDRQRRKLQDALLDTHFILGDVPIGLAGDPDMVAGFDALLAEVGAEAACVVASHRTAALEAMKADTVKIGDLEDLESMADAADAQILIANSHAARIADRLGVPLLRAGYPLYDIVGGQQHVHIGYDGACRTLFDLATLALRFHHGPRPYRSIFASQKTVHESHGQTVETCERLH